MQRPTPSTLEQKVPAAGLGAAAGVQTADFVTYLLSVTVYGGEPVPTSVSSFVMTWAVLGLTLAGAWIAPHTPRPDLFK